MTKRSAIAALSVFLIVFTNSLLFAQPMPSSATTKERVDADRRAQDELLRGQLPSDRVRANSPEQQKYDTDGSGWLQPWEAQDMMEDQSSTRIKGGPVPTTVPVSQGNWYEEETSTSEQDSERDAENDTGSAAESPDGYTY